MCWKKRTSSQPKATSTSITLRLTVLYLVSTLAILLSIGTFLLKTLVDDLIFEDNDFLTERITSIRGIISRHPESIDQIRDHVQINRAAQQTRYLVRIQAANGDTLLESPGIAAIAPGIFPPPVITGHPVGLGKRYEGNNGRSYLLNAAWAEGHGDGYYRQVQVALDITDEVALMANYRLKMGIALLTGFLVAGGLSILVIRRELRPLRQVADTVTRITATDLHQRVRTGAWPGELDQLTVALDKMLEQLETDFGRLTEFSANLAHELRTPLNNLRGEAEVALSRARDADEYRRTIESSLEEYERLSRMISDILFLARPEQGIALQPLNVRAEIDMLADYYQALADERQVSLQVTGNGTAIADARLFQRAVGNLVANAIYYTPANGKVELAITPDADGSMTITVADTGMGIPAEELPHVFDRFRRSSKARQRHPQGSGLGLAIVRSIMDLHGGTIRLTSEPDHGTRVTLHFPAS